MAFHGICSDLAKKITVNGVKKAPKKVVASVPPVINSIELSMLLAVGKLPQPKPVKAVKTA